MERRRRVFEKRGDGSSLNSLAWWAANVRRGGEDSADKHLLTRIGMVEVERHHFVGRLQGKWTWELVQKRVCYAGGRSFWSLSMCGEGRSEDGSFSNDYSTTTLSWVQKALTLKHCQLISTL